MMMQGAKRLLLGLGSMGLVAVVVVMAGEAQAQSLKGLDIDEHAGVLGRIDPVNRTVFIDGQRMQWHPERFQVRHAVTGQPVAVEKLRSGMTIGYALEAPGATPPPQRILTIYVREQP